MSEESNDSPAFRLRPRRSAPKSYYAVRLEYSANPAAFIRERPRTSSKRKVFSQKPPATNQTRVNQTGQSCSKLASTKEEQERDERRNSLRRSITDSITTGTLVSPFLQRFGLDKLEPNKLYEYEYVTLLIKQVNESISCSQPERRMLTCLCQDVDIHDAERLGKLINVELYDEYADSTLVKPGKMISIAKFRSLAINPSADIETTATTLPFTVIVSKSESPDRKHPVVPFISITEMIERPIDPYVEMMPSPKAQKTNNNNNTVSYH